MNIDDSIIFKWAVTDQEIAFSLLEHFRQMQDINERSQRNKDIDIAWHHFELCLIIVGLSTSTVALVYTAMPVAHLLFRMYCDFVYEIARERRNVGRV